MKFEKIEIETICYSPEEEDLNFFGKAFAEGKKQNSVFLISEGLFEKLLGILEEDGEKIESAFEARAKQEMEENPKEDWILDLELKEILGKNLTLETKNWKFETLETDDPADEPCYLIEKIS